MPGNPLTDPNWATDIVDIIVRYVGKVRDTATTRVVVVVRAIVFGTVIGLTSVATLVLAIILGTKFVQRLVNIGGWIDTDSSVWVSYLVMGAVLLVGGWLCMRQRHVPSH
jgi:hypothetical protein